MKIHQIENFISSKLCDDLINFYKDQLNPSEINYSQNKELYSKGEIDKQQRDASNVSVDPNIFPELNKVSNYIEKITSLPIENHEDFSLVKYEKGGQYVPHIDTPCPFSKNARFWSFLIYLNDNFKGGETEFDQINHKVTPKKGSLVYWRNTDPSTEEALIESSHSGLPVTEGEKWILITWIRKHPLPLHTKLPKPFNIKEINSGPLNYFEIQNAFNYREHKEFMSLFNYYKPYFRSPSETGGEAIEKDSHTYAKQNKGIFLSDLNPIPHFHNHLLTKYLETVFTTPTLQKNASDAFSGSFFCNDWSSLVSYYSEDNDSYLPHKDLGIITMLIWLHNGPTNFTGGDLTFPEFNITIPAKHNTGIIFPSWITHQVTPIKIIDPRKDSGRICISLFGSVIDEHV